MSTHNSHAWSSATPATSSASSAASSTASTSWSRPEMANRKWQIANQKGALAVFSYLLLAICYLLLLPACAHPAPAPRASPGDRGPAVGLTLHCWAVDDDPFDDNLKTGEAPRALPESLLPLA